MVKYIFDPSKAKDTFCSGLAYSFQAEHVQAEYLEACFLQNSLITQSEIWKGCNLFCRQEIKIQSLKFIIFEDVLPHTHIHYKYNLLLRFNNLDETNKNTWQY